jgi:hypothetical protein
MPVMMKTDRKRKKDKGLLFGEGAGYVSSILELNDFGSRSAEPW